MNPLIKSNLCLKWVTCYAVLRKNENSLPKKVFLTDQLPKFVCVVKFFICSGSRAYILRQRGGTNEFKLHIISPAQFEQSLLGVTVNYGLTHLNTHQDTHKVQGNTIHCTPAARATAAPT